MKMTSEHRHLQFPASFLNAVYDQGTLFVIAAGQNIYQAHRPSSHGINVIHRHHDGGFSGCIRLIGKQAGHHAVGCQKQKSVFPGNHSSIIPVIGKLGSVLMGQA